MPPSGVTSYLNRFTQHFTSKPSRVLLGTTALWGAFFETTGHYNIGESTRKMTALVLTGAINGAAIGIMLVTDQRIVSRHPLIANAGSVAAASCIVFGGKYLFSQLMKERK